MDRMTSRERMMITLRNGQADRVPVAPDISVMIPVRLSGHDFWQADLRGDPPIWRAYMEAVRYFGMDGWFTYAGLGYHMPVGLSHKSTSETIGDRIIMHRTLTTPDGDMTMEFVCPKTDPRTPTLKYVKDFKEDFKKIRHMFQTPTGYDDSGYKSMKEFVGEDGMMCVGINAPGFQNLVTWFNGNIEALTYAYYDHTDLFMELIELNHKQAVKMAEMAVEAKVDSILTGGSGSVTLQSPELWRLFSLPTLKEIGKMCREGGVISGIHSCGKEYYLTKTVAEETQIDYVNPLEIPPMGDCVLADVKREFGGKLALMGNLHTTETMLNGMPERVKKESLEAILDAGVGGGFVLSTGDQCGYNTPLENIFRMVETAKIYGVYPLDIEGIRSEIAKIGGVHP